jgi:hypothetical protein
MNLLRTLAAAALALAAFSAHAVGLLADVSIVDRSTRQELPVHWHAGRAYVVGRPGAEYQVILRNRLGEDLLAVVSVDGVNAVTGESAGVQQRGYVLWPWQSAAISGWRKSLEETASFYFTSLGDSYAGRTGRGENVGVIGVAVFRRAPPPEIASNIDKDARAAESAGLQKRFSAPAAAAPLGTGHGRRENSPVREVAFERATEQPAETITIYYDSHRNLVAQGVIAAPAAPRDPSPFPARFVPEPPR